MQMAKSPITHAFGAALSPNLQSVALPKRFRKCLPVYLVCVLFVIVLVNFDVVFLIPTSSSSQLSALASSSSSSSSSPRNKILPGHTFPQKIWQIWKIDPLLFGITETSRAMSWVEQNPQMRYEVITDANDMTYVEQHFGPTGFNRPDIVDFYRRVNLNIVKADLLRYMILYAEGGIYTDIDVEAIKPFQRFIPERHNEQDYDLIVGVEVDMPEFRNHHILGPKSESFCQWTIVSRPRHPAMIRLVEKIMKWLKGVAKKQGVPVEKVELDFDQVITGTGPSAFTAAVIEEMNVAVAGTKGHKKVTWDDFHDMDESKVVGRVLVLTVEAFCAGQGHSNSGNHGSRAALVKHHYHASNWPSRHPRYRHPAYGQVEECNWDVECVEKWDRDVATFEKLSEDGRREVIAQRLEMLQPRQQQGEEAEGEGEQEQEQEQEKEQQQPQEQGSLHEPDDNTQLTIGNAMEQSPGVANPLLPKKPRPQQETSDETSHDTSHDTAEEEVGQVITQTAKQ